MSLIDFNKTKFVQKGKREHLGICLLWERKDESDAGTRLLIADTCFKGNNTQRIREEEKSEGKMPL